MDPVAHTLVGATLAETRLKTWTPLATATLIIGANLPDIDAVVTFLGSDTSLLLRRGWTHGVLAMVILPILLAGLMVAVDRLIRRRRSPDASPARFWPLVGLSYIGVLTHPFLDWLNTYGVRLLMPFSGEWFYGDTLFIVDPWMWLLGAAAVVLAHSHERWSIASWIVLGCATTGLILFVDAAPLATKVIWLIGVGAIIATRVSKRAEPHLTKIATACALGLATYIGMMLIGTHLARQSAQDFFGSQDIPVNHVMAGPVAGNALAREGLIISDERYHFYRVDWTNTERVQISEDPIALPDAPGPVVEAALNAPSVRGFRNWLRYPAYQIQEKPYGYRVILLDLRYARLETDRFGVAIVDLDHDLNPISEAEVEN